jgi:hypothetical protein
MADVTSTDENDWGPEQTTVPPVGSIFLLRLVPNAAPIGATTHQKYKLVGYVLNGDPDSNLELEIWAGKQWIGGHIWGTAHKPTFRVLRTSATSTQGVKTHTSGCVCKRCNASNPWAAPNQPNGEYLCYECR